MLSAIRFNLGQFKILSSCNGLKAFADDNSLIAQMMDFRFESIFGKETVLLTAFSPFPAIFLKTFLIRVNEKWNCLVKGLTYRLQILR